MSSTDQASSAGSVEQPSSQEGLSSTDGSSAPPPKQSWVFTASTDGQLHAFELDTETGVATERGDHAIGSNGGDVFIAMAAGSTRLFAVYNRGIVAFDFAPESGAFTERARGTTLGGGTYVGISPGEQHAYVAHYGENQLTYLTSDGAAFSTAQGIAAGQKVHSAQESEAGGWVLVPCLGSDHVAHIAAMGTSYSPRRSRLLPSRGARVTLRFTRASPSRTSELSSELRTFEFTEAGGLGAALDTD